MLKHRNGPVKSNRSANIKQWETAASLDNLVCMMTQTGILTVQLNFRSKQDVIPVPSAGKATDVTRSFSASCKQLEITLFQPLTLPCSSTWKMFLQLSFPGPVTTIPSMPTRRIVVWFPEERKHYSLYYIWLKYMYY